MKSELTSPLEGHIIIQGGPGSFNDSALCKWLTEKRYRNVVSVFAQSTREVLRAVEEGDCEYGQFALHNSAAGFYDESLAAIGPFRFKLLACHTYPVEHALLTHPNARDCELTEIVTHAEVVKHCRGNIARRFSGIPVRIGEGQYHDPASVARDIANNILPASTATISNPALASRWGLHIAHASMHDHVSETTFVVVTKATS